MRTIAMTFDTRSQAEAASRLLQGIGVDPELILLRDLARASGAGEADAAVRPEAPASDGAHAGGTFLSAKVAPEQVAAASEILKGVGAGAGAPPESSSGGGDTRHSEAHSAVPAAGEPPLSFGGPPAEPSRPREPGPARLGQDQVRQGSQGPAGHRQGQSAGSGAGSWKRPLAIFCVAVLAAFIVGLVMGQLA